jgi:hypothetical protein
MYLGLKYENNIWLILVENFEFGCAKNVGFVSSICCPLRSVQRWTNLGVKICLVVLFNMWKFDDLSYYIANSQYFTNTVDAGTLTTI